MIRFALSFTTSELLSIISTSWIFEPGCLDSTVSTHIQKNVKFRDKPLNSGVMDARIRPISHLVASCKLEMVEVTFVMAVRRGEDTGKWLE